MGEEEKAVGTQQQEPTEETKETGEKKKHWAEYRLAEVSAKKREMEAEVEAYKARLAKYEAQLAATQQHSMNAQDDPDLAWSEKYFGTVLDKRLEEKLSPVVRRIEEQADVIDKETFWKDKADPPDFAHDVESMMSDLKAKGLSVQRQHVYWLVKGMHAEKLASQDQTTAAQNRQATAELNRAATVATGATPPPEPGKNFEELSAEEQFALLEQSGAFKKTFGR